MDDSKAVAANFLLYGATDLGHRHTGTSNWQRRTECRPCACNEPRDIGSISNDQDIAATDTDLVPSGKFCEDHPIARGISHRGGPHVV